MHSINSECKESKSVSSVNNVNRTKLQRIKLIRRTEYHLPIVCLDLFDNTFTDGI